MVKRTGGKRRKTRYKYQKQICKKGKISISRFFQDLKMGERVQLLIEPAYQNGMFFRRFQTKSGVICGKRGRCYEVMIKDLNKEKKLIVHPIHLKKIENI